MLSRTRENFGAPYQNQGTVEDPTTQADAERYNEMAECVAQLTRGPRKVHFEFPTVASGASTVVHAATYTQWGSGAAYSPTVTRTGVGAYTATFAASYADGAGVVETLAFYDSAGRVSDLGRYALVQTTESANVITIIMVNSAFAAVDLAAGTIVRIEGY